MTNHPPKYRRPLNQYQIKLLQTLYKFRYASIELIDKYLGKSGSKYSYVRLGNLVEQRYIGRRFTDEDKINRRSATYYMLPRGIKGLKAMPDIRK